MLTRLHFPNATDIAADEAAHFRKLSAADRIASIRSVMAAGSLLLKRSPKRDFLKLECLRQEELGRAAIKEFVARHADHS